MAVISNYHLMQKYKSSKLIKAKNISTDNRGYFYSLINDKIKNISYLYSKKNTIRSNHYHLKDFHYIYVIKGSIHYMYRSLKSKNIKYMHIQEGNTIFTPPLEIHTTYFAQNTHMLVANSQNRNKQTYEKDLVRYDLFNIKSAKLFVNQIKIEKI